MPKGLKGNLPNARNLLKRNEGEDGFDPPSLSGQLQRDNNQVSVQPKN